MQQYRRHILETKRLNSMQRSYDCTHQTLHPDPLSTWLSLSTHARHAWLVLPASLTTPPVVQPRDPLTWSNKHTYNVYCTVITWHTSGPRKKNGAVRILLNAWRRYGCLHQTSDPDYAAVVVLKSKCSHHQAECHTIIGCLEMTEDFKFIAWCC